MNTTAADDRLITVGEVRGVFGVQGWVKLYSWTSPRENLLAYRAFVDGQGRALQLVDAKAQGKTLIGRFDGITDRDAAQAMHGTVLKIRRAQLPAAEEDEYYWADLVGAAVENVQGERLGRVDYLMETGANDVMVLKCDDGSELLVPFIVGPVVTQVDTEGRMITVAWQRDDGSAA